MFKQAYTGHCVFFVAIALLFTACVGPKFMSSGSGSQESLAPLPNQQKAIIVPFGGLGAAQKLGRQTVSEYFTQVLAERLRATKLFSEVTVSGLLSDSAQVTISGSISDIGGEGWGKRAFVMDSQMSFSVSGEVRDQSNNKLMSFTKSRRAQGGACGMGGWLAADNNTMSRQLAGWVAADVANAIVKANKAKQISAR